MRSLETGLEDTLSKRQIWDVSFSRCIIGLSFTMISVPTHRSCLFWFRPIASQPHRFYGTEPSRVAATDTLFFELMQKPIPQGDAAVQCSRVGETRAMILVVARLTGNGSSRRASPRKFFPCLLRSYRTLPTMHYSRPSSTPHASSLLVSTVPRMRQGG